jgi:hypothetical protein
MKKHDFWKDFEKTGSVFSYLLYKQEEKEKIEISKEIDINEKQ